MYSLNELKPFLLNPSLHEGELVRGIHKIQESFNIKKDERDQYILDRDLVSCYAAFYLPTNMVKLSWALNQLPSDLISEMKESVLLDFGCGPGTFSLAWLEYFKEGKVLCCDQSDLMLEQAKKLLTAFFPESKADFAKSPNGIPENKYTLLFGHSLNEITVDDAMDIIKKVKPRNLVFIEPGTKAVFQELLKLREVLSKEFNLFYPCLDHAPCPMEKIDWCHQVIRTVHDESIERISQKAKIDRRTMPLCLHVYSKLPRLNRVQGRIIQFLRETKFSYDYRICLGDKIVEVNLLKKKLSKADRKKVEGINIGEELKFEIIKEINDKLFRVVFQERVER